MAKKFSIIPAIDLMKGRVVRLVKGDEKALLDYSHMGDPLTIAKRWISEGADLLHIVDLDGAKGIGDNTEIVLSIARSVNAKIQFGGGIRSLEKARFLLNKGIYRIILGSLALKSPNTVKSLIDEFGSERIAVALDYMGGLVLHKGWTEKTQIKLSDAVSMFKRMNCEYFLLTSISRDGTLAGPDFITLRKFSRDVKIIAAGGVRSLEDILKLKRMGVYGVIVGRALYEGRISLKKAIEAVKGNF